MMPAAGHTLRLRRVLAERWERCRVLCPTGGWKDVSIPKWERTAEGTALRDARIGARVGLREAAARAGCRAEEWSALESGRAVPVEASEWERLRRCL